MFVPNAGVLTCELHLRVRTNSFHCLALFGCSVARDDALESVRPRKGVPQSTPMSWWLRIAAGLRSSASADHSCAERAALRLPSRRGFRARAERSKSNRLTVMQKVRKGLLSLNVVSAVAYE